MLAHSIHRLLGGNAWSLRHISIQGNLAWVLKLRCGKSGNDGRAKLIIFGKFLPWFIESMPLSWLDLDLIGVVFVRRRMVLILIELAPAALFRSNYCGCTLMKCTERFHLARVRSWDGRANTKAVEGLSYWLRIRWGDNGLAAPCVSHVDKRCRIYFTWGMVDCAQVVVLHQVIRLFHQVGCTCRIAHVRLVTEPLELHQLVRDWLLRVTYFLLYENFIYYSTLISNVRGVLGS